MSYSRCDIESVARQDRVPAYRTMRVDLGTIEDGAADFPQEDTICETVI